MADQPKLLVVDDEEAICQGCDRIFSRQGFVVSKASNPTDGLAEASNGDYSAVLLDIKMPEMSGLDFLSQLRKTRQDLPVILMTGFPTMPSAISALRLGASGYVTKPFTPEEITQAVHQFAKRSATVPTPSNEIVTVAPPKPELRRFWGATWLLPVDETRYCSGALLSGFPADDVAAVDLPGIGETVYQGLPMARVKLVGGTEYLIPAPLTGVVTATNEALQETPFWLVTKSCTDGWVAEICATRMDEELPACGLRQVLVVSHDVDRATWLNEQLSSVGCVAAACAADSQEALTDALKEYSVVLLDADSLGAAGPELAAMIGRRQEATKIIVAASPASVWETDYRSEGIFYYAVDAFADDEMIGVLNSAFPAKAAQSAKELVRGIKTDESIAHISITNRKGTRVTLIAEPGMLYRNSGLGGEIRRLLYERLFPIQTMPGLASMTVHDVLSAARKCDRVVMLLKRDVERLPGSLMRDSRTEFSSLPEGQEAKVTSLVIQPADDEAHIDRQDSKTIMQLARHIVWEMEAE